MILNALSKTVYNIYALLSENKLKILYVGALSSLATRVCCDVAIFARTTFTGLNFSHSNRIIALSLVGTLTINLFLLSLGHFLVCGKKFSFSYEYSHS